MKPWKEAKHLLLFFTFCVLMMVFSVFLLTQTFFTAVSSLNVLKYHIWCKSWTHRFTKLPIEFHEERSPIVYSGINFSASTLSNGRSPLSQCTHFWYSSYHDVVLIYDYNTQVLCNLFFISTKNVNNEDSYVVAQLFFYYKCIECKYLSVAAYSWIFERHFDYLLYFLFRMPNICSGCTWPWNNIAKQLERLSSLLERNKMLVGKLQEKFIWILFSSITSRRLYSNYMEHRNLILDFRQLQKCSRRTV